MPNQKQLDERYLKMAREWSLMSHAKRKKVGCLVVKNGQIISDGYNGTPSGFDNNCEDKKISYDEKNILYGEDRHEWMVDKSNKSCYSWFKLTTKPEVLHAELNALMKLARSTNSSDGSTMYITCSPCYDCSKLIYQSGIKRVVYNEDYRSKNGVDFLKKCGVKVDKLNYKDIYQ